MLQRAVTTGKAGEKCLQKPLKGLLEALVSQPWRFPAVNWRNTLKTNLLR